jgi:hypothetical protein
VIYQRGNLLYTRPYRRVIAALPSAYDHDLIVLGVRKYFDELKVPMVDERHSPEGDEWDFVYDERLNRLYLERKESTFALTGDVSDTIIAALIKLFGKPPTKLDR